MSRHGNGCDCGDCYQDPRHREPPTCEYCGEPATERYLRQNLCDECAPSEERRFTSCSICEKEMDMSERSLPLCDGCTRTAQAHSRQIREATDEIGSELDDENRVRYR